MYERIRHAMARCKTRYYAPDEPDRYRWLLALICLAQTKDRLG